MPTLEPVPFLKPFVIWQHNVLRKSICPITAIGCCIVVWQIDIYVITDVNFEAMSPLFITR